jgi:hypothetical protein
MMNPVHAADPVEMPKQAPAMAVLRESVRVALDPWLRQGVSVWVAYKEGGFLLSRKPFDERLPAEVRRVFACAREYAEAPKHLLVEIYYGLGIQE